MKIFVHQRPELIPPASGIGRVVHAMYRWLPILGVELVNDYRRADVITSHTDIYEMPDIHCIFLHGLYWRGDPDSGVYNNTNDVINKRIISAVRKAITITVPSEWTGEVFRRDMRLNPIVVPHGIDIEEWTPGRRSDYILWGKNRGSVDVCDPTPAWELANRGYNVVSTFAPRGQPIPPRMSVTGAVPAQEMRDLLSGCYIYLSSVKETFGIQTLEAMAMGAPVLGFDWGGTRDIVKHKVNGYLVKPFDYDALEQGAEWLHQNHAAVSEAARHTAEQYSWEKATRKYVDVFEMTAQSLNRERINNGVAVVVTSYAYAHWLGEALRSLVSQQMYPSEVVVVDDASPDNTSEVAESWRQRFELEGIRFKVIRHESNQGVAAARNHGIEASQSPFVVCLDADDRLNPLYLNACRNALVKDRGCGIAYSGLGVIQPDGNVHSNVWTGGFDWEHQAKWGDTPNTTIPTGAMFRRVMWERSGGYRQKYAPGEDAEFYTRGLSLGFTAIKVSESPLIEYRMHGGGAHVTRKYHRIDDDKPWMRDRLYPLGAPSERPPLVRSYSDPLVAIHVTFPADKSGVQWTDENELYATLDSIVGQSWREWEVVIDPVRLKSQCYIRYPFIHSKHTAPLCISVAQGTILPNDFLQSKLQEYIGLDDVSQWLEGDAMASSCCGGMDAREIAKLQMLKQGDMRPLEPMQGSPEPDARDESRGNMVISGDFVRMEYIGVHVGASTFMGRNGTNRSYRGGNNPHEKYAMIHKEDVEKLTNTGDWRVVRVQRDAKGRVNEERPASDSDSRERVDTVLSQREPVDMATRLGGRGTLPIQPQRMEEVARVESSAKPLVSVDAQGQRGVVEEVVPQRFKRIEIPADALGELATDAPIEVVPTPPDLPAPVLPRIGRDDEWPTAETDAKINAELKKRKRG